MIKMIPAANMERLVARLDELRARAARVGQTLNVTVRRTGRTETREKLIPAAHPAGRATLEDVLYVEVEFAGDLTTAPGLTGWKFAGVAKVDEGGVVLVHHAEDGWRPALPFQCDCCNIHNGRRMLLRFRHEDGRTVSVGGECSKSYRPDGLTAEDMIAYADVLQQAREACDEALLDCVDRAFVRGSTLTRWMTFVVAEVRARGWISAADAEVKGRRSTAYGAAQSRTDARFRPECGPTPADEAAARELVTWAREQAPAWRGGTSFERNVAAIVDADFVSPRGEGIAAAIYAMRERERREAERAAAPQLTRYPAEVKARVRGVRLVVKRVRAYQSDFGAGNIITFDAAGAHRLVWFTSACPEIAEGDEVTATFTVKAHSVSRYDGQPETLVSRVAL